LVSIGGGILVASLGDFEVNGLAQNTFERPDVPVRGPQFQLGVPCGAQAHQIVVAAGIEIQALQRL